MLELKRSLDAKGHCLLEMPTGTGKTIALLSLITSYTLSKPQTPLKLIYCTQTTVHEMEKTLAELKLLHDYQLRHLGPQAKILALGLSSRKIQTLLLLGSTHSSPKAGLSFSDSKPSILPLVALKSGASCKSEVRDGRTTKSEAKLKVG
ncbi:hypothetical protein G4B88_005376 [Cannabis sativa]|uniref:Helicase ATP-binding domain-containing protein n=1 Tax=Cannabis sativa TaxID=3483 RepID=A0A7J6HAS5_CANSA|nr:hypothetical protein G4B88_005376 [Cannabis sativa]